MDKDQAINDVQEIKQIMEASRKKSSRSKYWIGPVLAILAVIVSGLVPYLAPFVAIGLLAGGVITWRRSEETIMKAIAAGLVAVGIALIIMFVLAILGPGMYLFSGARGVESELPSMIRIAVVPNPAP